MRCGCYALLLGLGLTFAGAQGTYEWFKNRSQTVTTYANFEKQKPTGGWFKVSDARLSTPGAMWMTSKYSDTKNKIYVPMLPLNSDKPDTKIHVLVEVDDAPTKQLVEEVSALDKNAAPDSKILQYMLKNRAKLYPTRPIEGMVKFGINDLQSKDRQKIAALNSDLASDFVVLQENARPNVGASLLMLVIGVVLLLMFVANLFGGNDNSSPQGQEAAPNAPATPPSNGSSPPPPMTGGSAG